MFGQREFVLVQEIRSGRVLLREGDVPVESARIERGRGAVNRPFLLERGGKEKAARCIGVAEWGRKEEDVIGGSHPYFQKIGWQRSVHFPGSSRGGNQRTALTGFRKPTYGGGVREIDPLAEAGRTVRLGRQPRRSGHIVVQPLTVAVKV